MGLLGKIERPVAGGDPRELWKTMNAVMDILDDLTITILPASVGAQGQVTEGDIQLNLGAFLTQAAASNTIPGYGGGGGTDTKGITGDQGADYAASQGSSDD
jgi:hypothetical protein